MGFQQRITPKRTEPKPDEADQPKDDRQQGDMEVKARDEDPIEVEPGVNEAKGYRRVMVKQRRASHKTASQGVIVWVAAEAKDKQPRGNGGKERIEGG